MLADELKKWEDDHETEFWNSGIILFCPKNKIFYKISFGDGSDSEPLDDCDDYLYIDCDKYNDDGCLEEGVDGGNMWFHRKDYNGSINEEKLIRNALEFADCPDIDNCIFIGQFN